MNYEKNAYTDTRRIQPGCEHRLGCKCETPFWLRERTTSEIEFEARHRMIIEENKDDTI
jgi:hypothetical protein